MGKGEGRRGRMRPGMRLTTAPPRAPITDGRLATALFQPSSLTTTQLHGLRPGRMATAPTVRRAIRGPSMKRSALPLVAGALALLLCAGCASGPQRSEVTGKITFQGEP